ncbi:MAG: TIGR03790 family protein [Verrucomicrobiota bacterium]
MKLVFFSILLLFQGIALSAAVSSDPDAESVVVLVNSSDPESVAIGDYYAKRRGIPSENIIGLKMPKAETIGIREYVETISNPLLNELLEREWISAVKSPQLDAYGRERLSVVVHRIRYLVTVRGVPLRFNNEPELIESGLDNIPKEFQINRGSVDSELALLTGPPNTTMTAFVPNPFFGGKAVSDTDANRVIKISRLDGPSKDDVIGLIDRTLEAEETGLMGRAYIDSGGPHKKGDEWINAAGDLAKAAFFDTDFESSRRLRSYGQRLDAPAIYVGWYRANAYGPWRDRLWSVPPGAIGYHLHSFSAPTVRSLTKGWIGALVAQGYCATFGYTYEPYLEFTVRPHFFLEYLLKGGSFGDAISISNPSLSWQTVAVGDPLYRPFKKGLEQQLEESIESPFSAYLGLRNMNRLEAVEGVEAAEAYARQFFIRYPSLAVAFRLAKYFEQSGQNQQAVEVLKFIRYISSFSRDENILALRIANLLHKNGESEMAFDIYQKLLGERAIPKDLKIALLTGGSPVAAAVGQSALSSRWNLEAQSLKVPVRSKK